jgi:hypothetical protein
MSDVWTVTPPTYDARDTYKTCISKVSDANLRARLNAICDDIEEAADEYEGLATVGALDQVETAEMVGAVTAKEMVRVYDQRMAAKKGPGRSIYDHIKMLPVGDRCPYCDQRNVSTLDHVLAKTLYPALAVTPLNLVGSCMECNKLKKATEPATAVDVILHPYFDDITEQVWLKASVVQQAPCALLFRVQPHPDWTLETRQRAKNQFALLELGRLYSSEAARELANIRQNLQRHLDSGGEQGVRAELICQRNSRRANRLNSWQTAMYNALADDQWFYGGGFAAV